MIVGQPQGEPVTEMTNVRWPVHCTRCGRETDVALFAWPPPPAMPPGGAASVRMHCSDSTCAQKFWIFRDVGEDHAWSGAPRNEWLVMLRRLDIEANVRLHMRKDEHGEAVGGAEGEFRGFGSDLAALALREAMSEVSEDTYAEAWPIECGDLVWSWVAGRRPDLTEGLGGADAEAHGKARIVALANASGVWWADYWFAVPLADWVDRHGPADGIDARPR